MSVSSIIGWNPCRVWSTHCQCILKSTTIKLDIANSQGLFFQTRKCKVFNELNLNIFAFNRVFQRYDSRYDSFINKKLLTFYLRIIETIPVKFSSFHDLPSRLTMILTLFGVLQFFLVFNCVWIKSTLTLLLLYQLQWY